MHPTFVSLRSDDLPFLVERLPKFDGPLDRLLSLLTRGRGNEFQALWHSRFALGQINLKDAEGLVCPSLGQSLRVKYPAAYLPHLLCFREQVLAPNEFIFETLAFRYVVVDSDDLAGGQPEHSVLIPVGMTFVDILRGWKERGSSSSPHFLKHGYEAELVNGRPQVQKRPADDLVSGLAFDG